MKQQLIVVILGTDKSGIISDIVGKVSETKCNILDSRHAIYGLEFSLTMILEGSPSAINRAELTIPTLCQQHDLLSMMKRTRQHTKQNLAHLFDVSLRGVDNPGQIKTITTYLEENQASISAFRQKTYSSSDDSGPMMRCKLVVSLPDNVDFMAFSHGLLSLCEELDLSAVITDKSK